MKRYIYIARKIPEHILSPLKEKYDVHMWEKEDEAVPRSILINESKKADAILSFVTDKIDEEILSGNNLKIVSNCAVGYDNIDVNTARKREIIVTNTPDVLTETTADLTFALLMTAARRIVEAAQFVKEGRWKSWSPYLLAGSDIYGKTIGIFGMGKIGEAVARRAKGFQMNILYHNRNRKKEAEIELGAVYCSFDELLKQSDFIVCLAPLTEETKYMFTKEAFQRMKPTAIFINASRGAIVDEKALYEALIHGQIAAAGLDVFEKEPIEKTHPLLNLPNVVALPHIGSASKETRDKMLKLSIQNIDRVLSGKEPLTQVGV